MTERRCHTGVMRRTIKKSFWVNGEEDYEIKMKAQAACLSEAELFRQLCKGYSPQVMPDDRFWDAMELMRRMADSIDSIAMRADNSVDMIAMMTEAKKWRLFQNAIEKEFIRPKRSDG